jgi:hypothetical protein
VPVERFLGFVIAGVEAPGGETRLQLGAAAQARGEVLFLLDK